MPRRTASSALAATHGHPPADHAAPEVVVEAEIVTEPDQRPGQAIQISYPGRSPMARYARLGDTAKQYARQSRAASTIRSYDSDWRDFVAWCAEEDRQPLPADPETVADYLSALAAGLHRKVSTIGRRMSALSQRHQLAGYASPTQTEIVRTVLKGIKRDPATNKHLAQKAPTLTEDVLRMAANLAQHRNPLIAQRDRAVLLVGFSGALRRSEIVGIDLEHLDFGRNGVIITLPRTKASQEQGEEIAIAFGTHKDTCPVRQLQRWIKVARIGSGPVFRQISKGGQIGPARLSTKAVALIVKRQAIACTLNPDHYGGHSLRAGFATQATMNGVPEPDAMRHTRHRSVEMYRIYVRKANRWKDNPTTKLGL